MEVMQRKGKYLLLVAFHMVSLLLPVLAKYLGIQGAGTGDLWLIYCALESAVLYFGADVFQGATKRPYLANFALHVFMEWALGPVFLALGTTYIHYYDETRMLKCGPILILFPETILENLPATLVFSTIWAVVRWAERGFQIAWFRKNLRKSVRNCS